MERRKAVLNINHLNVCGINSKLCMPEFRTLLLDSDFLCVTETKLGKFDDLDDPDGYKFKHKPRANGVKKSGGIVLVFFL